MSKKVSSRSKKKNMAGETSQATSSSTRGEPSRFAPGTIVKIPNVSGGPTQVAAGHGLTKRGQVVVAASLQRAPLGLRVTWQKKATGAIGVTFKLRWDDHFVLSEVPSKSIKEILDDVENMTSASIVSVRRLRSPAGRLSWIAGVVPRLWWAVTWCTRRSSQLQTKDVVEEQRRGNKKDTRDKAALVATNRCVVALSCLIDSFPGGL